MASGIPDVGYFVKPAPLRCNESEDNWMYTKRGTFYISSSATKKHGRINCTHTCLIRGGDDFEIIRSSLSNPIISGERISSNVFEARCKATDGAEQWSVLSGIVPNETVRQDSIQRHLPESALRLDIIMFGFDSMSRMTWMR